MSKDISLHDEMRDNRNVKANLSEDSDNTDCKKPSLFIKFDDRKWAGTLSKVYRHMKLMECTKYLEPNFSALVTPIVKYVAHTFKISPISTLSHGGASKKNNTAMMDVVVEEEEISPLKNSRKLD